MKKALLGLTALVLSGCATPKFDSIDVLRVSEYVHTGKSVSFEYYGYDVAAHRENKGIMIDVECKKDKISFLDMPPLGVVDKNDYLTGSDNKTQQIKERDSSMDRYLGIFYNRASNKIVKEQQ